MSTAFIVHTDDTPFVMRLALNLGDAGLITRISEPQAKTQHILQADAFNALKQSRFVIVCLTQAGLQNDWVVRQINTAREQSKVILRVQVEPVLTIPDTLAWINDTPNFDFSVAYEPAFNALLTKIIDYRTYRNFDNPVWDTVQNPYVGLEAFKHWDSPVFVGRDDEVRQALQILRDRDFLAIVGASGTGKTSLVNAGILPQIRIGAIDGADEWALSVVRPNTRPMLALWDSVLALHDEETDTITSYPQSALEILETTQAWLNGRQWLLVIDPLEHVFSHAGETERDQFFDVLRLLATMSANTKIITVLRSEFFSNIKEYPDVAKHFVDEQMLTLNPIDKEDIADEIRIPAQKVGVRLDTNIIAHLADDYGHHYEDLAALQYTLYQLFLRRDVQDNRLQLSDLNDMKGTQASIDTIAEAYFSELDEKQQRELKQYLLSLTNITQGAMASYQRTLPDAGEAISRLLSHPDYGLLTELPSTQPPLLRLTHPSLITYWMRFSGWVQDNLDDLTYRSTLRREQQDWYANNTDPAYLLHGSSLNRAEAWLNDHPDSSLAPFINASRREQDDRDATKQQTRRQLRWMATLRRAVILVFLMLMLLALAGMVLMLLRRV